MKKTSFFLFLSLFIFFGSCSRNNDFSDMYSTDSVENSQTALCGKEGAIRTVEEFIASLYEDNIETRSLSFKIKKVDERTIADYKGDNDLKARSSDLSEIPIYEVILDNHDNIEGFAVVIGENLQNIVAFVPEGCIADTIYNEGLAFWFRTLIQNIESSNQRTDEIDTRGAPTHDLYENVRNVGTYYKDNLGTEEFVQNLYLVETADDKRYMSIPHWYTGSMLKQEFMRAHVPVAWHQEHPYNMLISAKKIDGSPAKVGCFGIALSSIVAHYAYLPGCEHFNWKELTRCRNVLIYDENMPVIEQAALICKKIAEDTGATSWNNILTGVGITNQKNVVPTFQKLNYHVKVNYFYNDIVKNECKLGRPMLVGATSYKLSQPEGHAWVIDGHYIGTKYHNYIKRSIKKVNKKTMYSYDEYRCKTQIEMLHMIWGFKNENSNGWYASFVPSGATEYDFKDDMYLYSEIYPNN